MAGPVACACKAGDTATTHARNIAAAPVIFDFMMIVLQIVYLLPYMRKTRGRAFASRTLIYFAPPGETK